VMAGVNTRVVRRSNALQNWAYGHRFRYREVMGLADGPLGMAKAAGITGGLAAALAGMSFGPARDLLGRVLPKSGQGPSEPASGGEAMGGGGPMAGGSGPGAIL